MYNCHAIKFFYDLKKKAKPWKAPVAKDNISSTVPLATIRLEGRTQPFSSTGLTTEKPPTTVTVTTLPRVGEQL